MKKDDHMTTIKCPICKEKVNGEEGLQLSNRLREHMANVHEMAELTGTHRVGALHIPPSDYSEDTMSLREAEGPVRESWREEMKMWTSPPVPGREKEEERREKMLHQDRGAVTAQETMLMERRSAETRLEGVVRVECPMCDALITAPTDEDLSDDLRDHMADHHDIRPKRLAWLSARM